MKRLTQREITRYLDIAERTLACMKNFGYKVSIHCEYVEADDGQYAHCETDAWERTLVISLTENSLSKDQRYKDECIVHEVIHGLWGCYQAQMEEAVAKTRYVFEEQFINDMQRAIATQVLGSEVHRCRRRRS